MYNGRVIVFLAGMGLTCAGSSVTAQSGGVVPPQMPAMPSVAAPTFGGSFYTPGRITPPQAPIAPTRPSNETAAPAVSSASTETLPAAKNTVPGVTAADLLNMDTAGLLNGFTGSLSEAPMGAGTGNSAALLTNILTQLNAIKDKTPSPEKEAAQHTEAQPEVTVSPETVTPTILRFIVNGYDVRATCRTVYFSRPSSDGSFLLTGDRKYISDGVMRTETFYLLFRTASRTGYETEYRVEASVVQDYENRYSFVYQLAQRNELTARKTGNLVTMRVTEPSWNMDVLLNMADYRPSERYDN